MPDQTVGSLERGWKLFQKMLGAAQARRTRATWHRLAPDFERYVLTFLSGEIWARPGLDRRTRSLATIAALAALGRTNGLALNIRMALRNGATHAEIIEMLLHIAPYAGFPAAWDALVVAERVFSAQTRLGPPRASRRKRGRR